MNAVPALLRTTASSWTACPPGPPGWPPARAALALLALVVAAPPEAMPPAAPSAAHTAATPTILRGLFRCFMLTLLVWGWDPAQVPAPTEGIPMKRLSAV